MIGQVVLRKPPLGFGGDRALLTRSSSADQSGTLWSWSSEGSIWTYTTAREPARRPPVMSAAEAGITNGLSALVTPMGRYPSDDMDFNAGVVLEEADMRWAAAQLLDLVIDVASGQPSKSEAQGLGELEFTPWHLGGTL